MLWAPSPSTPRAPRAQCDRSQLSKLSSRQNAQQLAVLAEGKTLAVDGDAWLHVVVRGDTEATPTLVVRVERGSLASGIKVDLYFTYDSERHAERIGIGPERPQRDPKRQLKHPHATHRGARDPHGVRWTASGGYLGRGAARGGPVVVLGLALTGSLAGG